MSLLDDVERRIDAAVRELFRSSSSQGVEKEMIEIQRGIVEDALGKVERLPRARKLFPYNHLGVRIALPSKDRRAAYEAVFSPDAIKQDVSRALREDGVELPQGLDVDVSLGSDPKLLASGFVIKYSNESVKQGRAPEAAVPRTVLTLSDGTPVRFNKPRIHIGRLTNVQDTQLRTIRKNDIALDHETVSRAHAHIRWDGAAGSFRVFDDGSSQGTSVWRDGRLMPVPKGPKGFALRSGDELVLGQARVLFEIEA
jgi:hypothetical protein